MKNSDFVQLIESLTQGEKRVITLQSKKTTGEKRYLELLKIVQRTGRYDPKYISEILEISPAKVAALKQYLVKIIFSSLRHDQRYEEATEHLDNARMLMARSLPGLAEKEINKANAIIGENNFLDLELQAVSLQGVIQKSLYQDLARSAEIFEDQQDILKKIDCRNEIQAYLGIVINYGKKDSLVRDPEIKQALLQINDRLDSLKFDGNWSPPSEVFFLRTKGILNTLIGEFEVASIYIEKYEKILKEKVLVPNPDRKWIDHYVHATWDLIQLYQRTKNIEKGNQIVNSLNRVGKLLPSKSLANISKCNTLQAGLFFALYSNNIELILNRISQMEEFVSSTNNQIPAGFTANSLLICAYGYFLIGDSRKALSIIQNIESISHKLINKDTQVEYRILRIINYVYKNDLQLLPYSIQSLEHYLNNQDYSFDIELYFLSVLKKAIKAPVSEVQSIFLDLADAIEKSIRKGAFSLIDVPNILKSMYNNRTPLEQLHASITFR